MVSTKANVTKVAKRGGDIRERVLRAGFETFRDLGFDGASTLEIATRAKVSKRELYALFDDKQSIIVECIKWRAAQIQLPLRLPRPSTAPALAATLAQFGAALITGVCDPAVLTVFRFAVAEAQRTPGIARALNERGREPSRRLFVDLVGKAQADGLLAPAPPAEIAAFFFSLLWGDLLLQLLMGLAEAPSEAEIGRRAAAAAGRVMAAYGRPGNSRSSGE